MDEMQRKLIDFNTFIIVNLDSKNHELLSNGLEYKLIHWETMNSLGNDETNPILVAKVSVQSKTQKQIEKWLIKNIKNDR